MRRAAAVSFSLHGLVLGGLILWLAPRAHSPDAPDTPVFVELVLRAEQGANAQSAPEQEQATEAPAEQPPLVASGPDIEPSQTQADMALPSGALQQTVPSPPSTAPATKAQPAMETNLGGTGDLTNAIVQGPTVLPAKPDSHYRNREPVYPIASAVRREHGTVDLMIHVSPEGLANSVDVLRTSGFPLLDAAARDAVASWRFLPAVKDGAPVPGEMAIRVVFQLR